MAAQSWLPKGAVFAWTRQEMLSKVTQNMLDYLVFP